MGPCTGGRGGGGGGVEGWMSGEGVGWMEHLNDVSANLKSTEILHKAQDCRIIWVLERLDTRHC